MTELEEFEQEYERAEKDAEMYFSTYFIPKYYQQEENDD